MEYGPLVAKQRSGLVRRKPPARVTADGVLAALDAAGSDFPGLVSFSWRYGGSRLHAFADARHWAIVIEEVTYGFNGPVDSIPIVLRSFGDALPARNRKNIWLHPIERGPCGVFCYDKDDEDRSYHAQRLHPDAKNLRIRGKVVKLDHDPKRYAKLGIRLEYKPEILKAELLPFLVETFRDRIFATDRELGIKLPRLLKLDAWLHPDTYSELPSSSESFRQIAAVLEHRDPTLYKVRGGNTRWDQRPE
jgi:hypothetical protein